MTISESIFSLVFIFSIEPCYLSMQIIFTDELFALYVILEWLSFIILIHITDNLVKCVNMSYISCVLVNDSQGSNPTKLYNVFLGGG